MRELPNPRRRILDNVKILLAFAVFFQAFPVIAEASQGQSRFLASLSFSAPRFRGSFTYSPLYPAPGQAVQFTDTSTGSPISWQWDFGDGTTSTAQNPSHVFKANGFYRVTLTARSSSGTKSARRTITLVGSSTPVAAFSFTPGSSTVGQTLQFTDTSTGSPTSWQWSFGDGGTSTAQNPSHAYTTAGTKTVTLTVANSSGSNSVSRTVAVVTALTASFTFSPASPTVGQAVQFTDTSTGSPTSWQWNFNDGSTSTSRNPRHAFTSAGSYTVSLTVMNASGQSSTSRTITVAPTSILAASFTCSPTSPAPTQSVQFTDTSTGTPTSWQWSFGDGTTSNIRNPSHIYRSAGSYPVSLIVNNFSGSDTASRTVTVAMTLDLIPPDRLIDWTYAGVPGGIPTRTMVYRMLTPANTASEIVAAIAACPPGRVVLLSAGTYNIGAISLGARRDVTLRGEGPGITVINGSFSSNSGTYFHPNSSAYGCDDAISSGYTKGSTSVTLASTPGAEYAVGNLIQIVQTDDYDLVWHRDGNYAGDRNRRHTSRITAVNGNTIAFATPIPYDYEAAYRPQCWAMTAGCSLFGIENLTINAGSSEPIRYGNADRCWLNKVEITGGSNALITMWSSVQCEIRRCYIHNSFTFPDGADGYGILLQYGCGNCRIEDNIICRCGYGMMFNGTSSSFVGYNYVRDMRRTALENVEPAYCNNHGPHGLMNLWEGNIGERWQNDGYHGSSSHQVIFRNSFDGDHPAFTQDRWLVDLVRGSYYHSVIGNVIGSPSWTLNYYEAPLALDHTDGVVYRLGWGTPGSATPTNATTWTNWVAPLPDAKVSATLIRHGNYDYYNNSTIWDNSISSRTLPSSLIYASKPDYFGLLQWPPIGPDVIGLVSDIPVRARWNAYVISGNLHDLF